MLIKFIITKHDGLQIETFDIDMEKNRVCKLHANNRDPYIRALNDYILKDVFSRRIVPE